MKILMLNYEFPPIGGGGGVISFELARQMVRLDHSVDVVTMQFDALDKTACVEGVNVYRTAALRKKKDVCQTHEMLSYLLGAMPKLASLIRHNHYDLVHAHFIFPTAPLAWLVSRMADVPFMVTSHGSDVPGHNPTRFTLAHELLAPLWRQMTRQCPLIITPSQSHRQLIMQQEPQANVSVIPNGFDAGRFKPCRKEKKILMCSRLLDFKGFQYALEAMENLSVDWEVEIIGDGPYLPQLESLARSCSVPVKFYGWLDQGDPQWKKSYETSSIFIFPSEAENFPTVLLEAMAAGMAIITSNAGGCPEVVGDAALLVAPRDSGAIFLQLEKLIHSEDLRQSLSKAALERVKMFSWESVSQLYLDSYHSVM